MGKRKSEHCSRANLRARSAELNKRGYDALTDLLAYALGLDIEYQLVGRRVEALTQQESSAAERRSLLRERAELAEEVEAFRGAIAAYREQLHPQ